MSGAPPIPGAPGTRNVNVSNGPPASGMGMPPQPTNIPPQQAAAVQPSQANLNQIVLEYLNKKGYTKTEATLRRESASQDVDGRPNMTRTEDAGGTKYQRAFDLLRNWIEDNLDVYKPELRRLLWPLFVYSILSLALEYYSKDCGAFFTANQDLFVREHGEDLRKLTPIQTPEHVSDSPLAKIYRSSKYRLSLSSMAFNNLMQFLESKEKEGGLVITSIITNYMNVVSYDRAAAGNERTISAILAKGSADDDVPAEDEGIPGHKPGSANTDPNAPQALTRLHLGQAPMEQDLMEDVRAALQEEDRRRPPQLGQSSLEQRFDQQIKREPTEEVPREMPPLPPSLARDVAMEVQKIKENRDRFKIEGRTNGVGPGISVTMFTFHNTFDSINCADISGDNELIAVGTAESYIRVWSLRGEPLKSELQQFTSEPSPPSSSRRLVGHSGPVYGVSFSPSTANPNPDGPSTASQYLLSCSADKTVRLWSLQTWTCLVAYKSHDNPVWDITWGPYGYYFLTGSHDHTARLWSTDHIEPLRLFVGHDGDVDCVAFHPNGAYVFTGSCDKTVRMWLVHNGNAVRMFTGHTGNITAIACSPDGQTLASADDVGSIFLWDLKEGRRKKRMRGHSKGGIWSLSWSVESTVLISGGADGTVRVWDVLQKTADSVQANGKIAAEGGSGTKIDAGIGTTSTSSARKGKAAKDVVITPDQIGAFPTKKSPVYKVMFTRMNLALAAGSYMP